MNGILMQGWLYGRGAGPVAELDGQGNMVSQLVGGAYLVRSDGTYRIIKDHLDSPRIVVDVNTGNVVERIDYDERGNVVFDSAPGFQSRGFANGLYDGDTGLVRFGARDYDPETGRWTNKDPLGFDAGLNFYEYAGCDPVNFVDPSGQSILIFQNSPSPQTGPGTLTLIDGDGNMLWSVPAGNRVTSPGADPLETGGNGPAPYGMWQLSQQCNNGSQGQYENGSLDILVPQRPGEKVHSGRPNKCTPDRNIVMCGTQGCIRVDEGTIMGLCAFVEEAAGSDPLDYIFVVGPGVTSGDYSSTTVDAISGGDVGGDGD